MQLVSAMPREASQTSPKGIIQKQVLPKNVNERIRSKRNPGFAILLRMLMIPLRFAAQVSKAAKVARIAHAVKTVGGKTPKLIKATKTAKAIKSIKKATAKNVSKNASKNAKSNKLDKKSIEKKQDLVEDATDNLSTIIHEEREVVKKIQSNKSKKDVEPFKWVLTRNNVRNATLTGGFSTSVSVKKEFKPKDINEIKPVQNSLDGNEDPDLVDESKQSPLSTRKESDSMEIESSQNHINNVFPDLINKRKRSPLATRKESNSMKIESTQNHINNEIPDLLALLAKDVNENKEHVKMLKKIDDSIEEKLRNRKRKHFRLGHGLNKHCYPNISSSKVSIF